MTKGLPHLLLSYVAAFLCLRRLLRTVPRQLRLWRQHVLRWVTRVVLRFDRAGMDISDIDLLNIQHFSTRVVSLVEVIIRPLSRCNIAVPWWTVQLPGGEDAQCCPQPWQPRWRAGWRPVDLARRQLDESCQVPRVHRPDSRRREGSLPVTLFCLRVTTSALKTKGNTPKYGLLYNASFIGRAGPKFKGRISRYGCFFFQHSHEAMLPTSALLLLALIASRTLPRTSSAWR